MNKKTEREVQTAFDKSYRNGEMPKKVKVKKETQTVFKIKIENDHRRGERT